MNKKKNLTLIFDFWGSQHFGKDPFMVPYYLGKLLDYNVKIIYPLSESNKDMPSSIKGVELHPLAIGASKDAIAENFVRASYKYIWQHAKEIDLLMRFFDTDTTRKVAMIYKLRNPKGKVYVKMDVNPYGINDKISSFPNKILAKLKDKIFKSFVDVISCETQLALQKLNESPNTYNHWGSKIVCMPNGFDEELLASLKISEKVYTEKENVMITVGRLGTPQKNTPMLLQALAKADLKDWKFYLVGSVDPKLQPEIDTFYEQNPKKKENVIFTGPIYDKKELWEYYNRSKVFVLTSKFESFGLVFAEAQRFANYIVSTKVGAACDVIQDCKYGDYIGQDDAVGLMRKIEGIVCGKTNVNVYDNFDVKTLSWEERLKVIVGRLNKEST